MGDMVGAAAVKANVDGLNNMFRAGNVDDTLANVRALRKVFPQLLTYVDVGPPRRRQSLRFAAWLLTDKLTYDGTFPINYNAADPKKSFKKWLKWLTWLDRKERKNETNWLIRYDGADFSGPPGQLIRMTLFKAFDIPPHVSVGQPINWTWNQRPASTFELIVDTRPKVWQIEFHTVHSGHSSVNTNDNDQDDDP